MITQRLPLGVMQSEVSEFNYFGSVYLRVPEDSPEFEYDLIQKQEEDNKTISLNSVAKPLKLIRGYHPRRERLMEMRIDGNVVETDKHLNVTGNVPYSWVPVIINGKVNWFIKK